MLLTRERPWTAQLVLSTEHAGLKPHFKRLEDRLYGCLSELDSPRQVRDFLVELSAQLELERARLKRLAGLNGRQGRGGLR